MDHPTPEVFDAIRDAAEAAIREAGDLPLAVRQKLGAVNWGDIGAGEVVHCRNREGETWFDVEIGEASVHCGLTEHVREALAKAFPGERFQVRAEW